MSLTPEQLAKIRAQYEANKAQIAELERAANITDGMEASLDKAGQVVRKGFDLQGGAARRAIVGALGREDLLTDEEKDWGNVANPNSPVHMPGSNELMRRAGVSEGATLSELLPSHLRMIYAEPGEGGPLRPEKGGMLDPSLRGVVGTALDMVTDPLTYESMGASAAGKVIANQNARAMERGTLNITLKDRLRDAFQAMKKPLSTLGAPTKNAAEYTGNAMYRSQMRPLDKVAVEAKKGRVSPLLMENKVWGPWSWIDQGIQDKAKVLEGRASKLASHMDDLDPVSPGMGIGVGDRPKGGVDMWETMDEGQKATDALKGRTAELEDLRKVLQDQINFIKGQGQKTRKHAIRVKSDLYNTIPDSAWDAASRSTPGGAVKRQMAHGIKRATETVPADAGPELKQLAGELGPTTEEWGRFLTVKDEAAKEAAKEANRAWLTRSDVIGGAGMNAAGTAGTAGSYLAVKKGLDALRAPLTRSGAGLMMNRYGTFGKGVPASLMDGYLRSSVLEELRPNPWTLMREEGQEE
jgi:hypothetical protein